MTRIYLFSVAVIRRQYQSQERSVATPNCIRYASYTMEMNFTSGDDHHEGQPDTMQTVRSTSALIILIVIILTCDARSSGLCRNRESCEDRCNKCKWGSTWAAECNFVECAKGPGERCGGRHDMWGKCGEGLVCQCNKCHGCSTTDVKKDCYEKPCIPEISDSQWPADIIYFLNA